MKKFLKIMSGFMILFVLLIATNVSFKEIFSLPQDFVISYDEISSSNISKKFGTLVSTNIDKNTFTTTKDGQEEGVIVFKLFGLIPIRKVKVKLAPEEEVFIGGVPIGVYMQTDGVIVVKEDYVESEDGDIITQKSEKLKKGDLIYQINESKIHGIDDVKLALKDAENKEVNVKFLRKNREMNAVIKCEEDKYQNLKLGLLVKDDISGIGTLTYVNSKTGQFGALGHAITEEENVVNISDGKVYTCNIFGVQKGERNNPGQLKGVFLQNSGEKGILEKNNKYGVFGKLNDMTNLVDENLTSKIGGRLSVSPGKASIISNVSGIREEYEIEIIKANYQAKADDKSIVFRVKDKRLLDITGGIVQGMSGSPILQNGKLIGAVTHVFTSDPTKGYGVYSDWMVLNN